MNDYRPKYHLYPSANWMNDPDGAIQWKGQYHLFYQYNPYAPISKNKHWAHVVSDDLIHWNSLPVALTPTPGGYDKDGCFSGCAVVNQGTPTLIYTGVMPEVQCLATSSDDLLTWEKHPANPVLSEKPAGQDLITWRDPYAWQEADGAWYMLLSSGIRGTGGTCLLYRSPDLMHWEYLHPLFSGKAEETGRAWDCPSFLSFGDRHLLIVSGEKVWKTFYWTGQYQEHHFIPQCGGQVDYGSAMYATQVFKDEAGRAILWGWLWENCPDEDVQAAGWAGVMALPRVLSINPDGTLAAAPVPEINTLRGSPVHVEGRAMTEGLTFLDNVQGDCLEIEACLQPGLSGSCGIAVFCSPDEMEMTLIGYDAARQEVYIDRSQARLKPRMVFNWENVPYHAAKLPLKPGEALELHIFLDRSVIEVFANHGLCLTTRVYPECPESKQVALYSLGSQGGEGQLISLDAWEL